MHSSVYYKLHSGLEAVFGNRNYKQTKMLCINYRPVTVFNQLMYKAFLSTPDKDSEAVCKVAFKRTYSSHNQITSVFRSNNYCVLELDSICAKASTLLHEAPDTLEGALFERAKSVFDFSTFDLIHTRMLSRETRDPLADQFEILYAQAVSLSSSRDILSSFLAMISSFIDAVRTSQDMFDDIALYIDYAWPCSNSEEMIEHFDVTSIPELSAINIITPYMTEIAADTKMYNYYMFVVNYELLQLFSSGTHSRVGNELQNTFCSLNEFVPILMKFSGVPNPILEGEYKPGVTYYDALSRQFPLFKEAENIINTCNSAGRYSPDLQVASDIDPDDPYCSRIYYGMCCDFDEIYGARKNIHIIPDKRVEANKLKYTAMLSAGVLLQMLSLYNFFPKWSDIPCMVASAEDDTGSYLTANALVGKPLLLKATNIAQRDLRSSLLLQAAVDGLAVATQYDLAVITDIANRLGQALDTVNLNEVGGFLWEY